MAGWRLDVFRKKKQGRASFSIFMNHACSLDVKPADSAACPAAWPSISRMQPIDFLRTAGNGVVMRLTVSGEEVWATNAGSGGILSLALLPATSSGCVL